jgi:hypothetical protein
MTTQVKHSKYYKIKPKEYKEWAAKVLDYEQYDYPKDLDKVTKLIHKNLTINLCPPRFREKNMGNPMFGHCYHATQALYYFFKDANLKTMSAPCDVAGSHWWCEDVDGNIIDITQDQYLSVGTKPPHDKGKETGWYGWKNRPHVRSLTLMNNVQPSSWLRRETYCKKPKQSY